MDKIYPKGILDAFDYCRDAFQTAFSKGYTDLKKNKEVIESWRVKSDQIPYNREQII